MGKIIDFMGIHLKESFVFITLLIIGIGFGISFATDEVKIEGADVGIAIASAGRSIVSIITMLVTASILMCSLGELSKCKERNGYGMPVPLEQLLAFDPSNMPYDMPPKTLTGKLTRSISIPISFLLGFLGYSNRGNPNVNFFYRKSNSFISMYTANVFITSWTWMRETLYNMIVFLNTIYPIEEKMKEEEEKKTEKSSVVDTISDNLRGGLLIWFSGQAILIMSIFAAIAGYVGMLIGSVEGPVKLIPGLNIALLMCFGFIGFFVSILQFGHNIYLFLSTLFKKSGLSITKILYFLCDKYFITILLSMWIPSIGKWLISENADFTILFLDIGITYILLSIGFLIFKTVLQQNKI
jgi:hypothetical protein